MPSPSSRPELDSSSAAALYRQHAPALFAWLRRQTSSWEDAEDLLLEAFLAAFERDQFAAVPADKRLAWLVRVAQHKLIDYYRRSNRRPVFPLDEVAEALEADEALAPEQMALRHERHAELHAALQRLPRLYQEVLRLRFADGLRCAEIAAVLGKREGAVRVLLWRALKLLRIRYEEDEKGRSPHGME
jgi:RNA polymerase sigma-70 factor (ECF subfamily)